MNVLKVTYENQTVFLEFPSLIAVEIDRLNSDEDFQKLVVQDIGQKLSLERIAVEENPLIETASWDSRRKVIHLNLSNLSDVQKMITHLLIELFNAAKDQNFSGMNQLPSQKISPEMYIRRIELLEHDTLKKTNELIKKVFKNFQPPFFFEEFELHFLYQGLKGHSDFIYRQFLEFSGQPSVFTSASTAFPLIWKSEITLGEKTLLLNLMDHLLILQNGPDNAKALSDRFLRDNYKIIQETPSLNGLLAKFPPLESALKKLYS